MTSMPPGWYDDGRGALRWWDGTQWTEHTAAPDPEVDAPGDAESETAEIPPELRDPPVALAPDGYPGGSPVAESAPESGGAFISATEPHKSRLWIVWAVIGAVLLAIVIGLAVLIPMALLRSAGGSPTPTPTVFSEAEQQQAIDAVMLYDQAYQTNDCDAYFASTTQNFRELFEATDCATFEANAAGFAEAYVDYVVTVTSVSQDDASLSVFTSETYSSPVDADGNPTDELQPYQDDYKYIVVPTEDGWALWDAFPD